MVTIDLSPPVFDILGLRAGDRNALQIWLTNKGDDSPLDLTGYAITAEGRLDTLSAVAITGVVEDRVDTDGTFILRWPGDAVRMLLGTASAWTGVWDLQLLGSGQTDAITCMAGKLGAVLDVTRPGGALRERRTRVNGHTLDTEPVPS